MNKQNIEVPEQNTFTLTLTVTQTVAGVVSPYVLPAGATVKLYVKTAKSTADNLATVFDGTITDAPNGKATFAITTAVTGTVGSKFYRVDVNDTAGLRTVASGSWKVIDV